MKARNTESRTYPQRRILLARWGRWSRPSGCHLGTRRPCSLPPGGQRLLLQRPHRRRLEDSFLRNNLMESSSQLGLFQHFPKASRDRDASASPHHDQPTSMKPLPFLFMMRCFLKVSPACSDDSSISGCYCLPITNTGMKAPQGTGMVMARADIQNWGQTNRY